MQTKIRHSADFKLQLLFKLNQITVVPIDDNIIGSFYILEQAIIHSTCRQPSMPTLFRQTIQREQIDLWGKNKEKGKHGRMMTH